MQAGCDRLLDRARLHHALLAVEAREDLDDLRKREQVASELQRHPVERDGVVDRRRGRLADVLWGDQRDGPIGPVHPTLRWSPTPDGCDFAPGWVTALTDRRVAKAIRAVHADLARPWTVAEMAREAGVSRSSFAAAFRSAVGESPLDYVTSWRIYRAKVLLSSSDESLAEIASRVGYDSDTALSRAFKRKVGMPPGTFRRTMSARPAGARGD